MELKSLMLGIVLAVSIFAVKSGIGMTYLVTRMKNRKRRIWIFLGSALSYGLLFAAAFFLLRGLNQVALFPLFSKVMKYGMPLHFSLAFGMFVWAVYLLKRDHAYHTSRAFLLLVVPCPVCLTVVVLITAFIMAYFPKNSGLALIGVYAIYLAIQGITMLVFSLWQKASQMDSDRVLGWGMLLIAGYFILTVLIAPQMGDLKNIYRIANYKGETELLKLHWTLAVWLAVTLTFAAGAILRMRHIKRRK
jgi:predicted transporter